MLQQFKHTITDKITIQIGLTVQNSSVWRTEPQFADDTTEMVFVDQSEELRHESAETVPRRARDILARPVEERHQPGR